MILEHIVYLVDKGTYTIMVGAYRRHTNSIHTNMLYLDEITNVLLDDLRMCDAHATISLKESVQAPQSLSALQPLQLRDPSTDAVNGRNLLPFEHASRPNLKVTVPTHNTGSQSKTARVSIRKKPIDSVMPSVSRHACLSTWLNA